MRKFKKVKPVRPIRRTGFNCQNRIELRGKLTKLMVKRFGAPTSHSAAARSFFSRLARNCSKSSPAWCDERVSGLEETMRKPLV